MEISWDVLIDTLSPSPRCTLKSHHLGRHDRKIRMADNYPMGCKHFPQWNPGHRGSAAHMQGTIPLWWAHYPRQPCVVAESTGACTGTPKLVAGFGEGGQGVLPPLYVLSFTAFKGNDASTLSTRWFLHSTAITQISPKKNLKVTSEELGGGRRSFYWTNQVFQDTASSFSTICCRQSDGLVLCFRFTQVFSLSLLLLN